MDQINNNPALAMFQNMAAQTQVSKMGKGDADSEFQKLMDKAASGQPDSKIEERPKAKTETAVKKDKAPVQKKEEDPVEASKKAQMVIMGQLDPETLPDPVILENPVTGEELTLIQGDWAPQVWAYESAPEEIAGDLNAVSEDMQLIDVSDPKADAMLEATAPGADNSPAAMLEKVVAEQTGQEIQPDAGETQPQQQDDDTEVELIDAGQGAQQIFHDVKAAPVKVGEVEKPQEAEEPDVAQQLDGQIGLAIERGDSSVTVRLNPENLGEVTIQISVKDNGVLSVALNAKNDATRALLDRHSDNLQQLLGSRVRQTVEVDVQRQSESQQGQNQQHQNYEGHNGHAQDGQERRQKQHEPTSSQDFMQQLRLGLIPTDGEL